MSEDKAVYKVDKEKALRQEVAHILLSLGICPSHKGYKFLIDSIMFVLGKPEKMFFKMTDIYNYLDEKYHEGMVKTERNMRTAIEYAWRENSKLWQDTFGLYLQPKTRPTNSFFIATFAELYKLDMMACYEDEDEL